MKRAVTAVFLCLVFIFCPACEAGFLADFFETNREPAAPEEPPPAEYPVTVMGVSLNDQPHTVISLSPALTEMAFGIGLYDFFIGVSDYCEYPGKALSLPKCGTVQIPDLYVIRALKPDIIIASTPLTEADMIMLQQMDIKVIVLPRANSFETLDKLYLDLCLLMLGEHSGKLWYDEHYAPMREKLDNISLLIKRQLGGDYLNAAYLRMLDYIIATGDTIEGEVLELLGCVNVAKSYDGWIYPRDAGNDYKPDVIIYDSALTQRDILNSAFHRNTPAVNSESLYAVDATIMERQGRRMFDKIEEMARLIYPYLFESEQLPPLPQNIAWGEIGNFIKGKN